jgi:uncharacterized protein (TIGR03382 family)
MWMLALTLAMADVPADAPVDLAIAVDVSQSGLDALGEAAVGLVPSQLDVPYVYQGSTCLYVEMFDLSVGLDIRDLQLLLGQDRVDFALQADVSINDQAAPFEMASTNPAFICIPDWCRGYVEPFDITVTGSLSIRVSPGVNGVPDVTASVTDLDLRHGLDSGELEFQSSFNYPCAMGGLVGLVLPALDGVISDTVAGLAPDVEQAIEDALASLVIDQEVPLGEAMLRVALSPVQLTARADGARIVLQGQATTDAADACVAPFDDGIVAATASPLPQLGGSATLEPHASVWVSDEFVNQALYAVWRSGAICQEVGGDLGGFSIDTTLLETLLGPEVGELAGASPVTMRVVPERAPLMRPDLPNDVDIGMDLLGLDTYVEIEGRQTRLLQIQPDLAAGVQLPFDVTSGTLTPGVALAPEDLTIRVPYSEILSQGRLELEQQVAGSLRNLVPVVLGLVDLGQLDLPSLEGQGLSHLTFGSSDGGDWLGVHLDVGPVPYDSTYGYTGGCDEGCGGGCSGELSGCGGAQTAGCGGGGGCGTGQSGGCDGSGDAGCGCVGRPNPRFALPWLAPVLVVLLRRRRRS